MVRAVFGDGIGKATRYLNYIVVGLVLIGLGIAAYAALPPSRIIIATGPVGGSYYENAEKYKKILSAEGVDLILKPVPNSLDIVNYVESETDGVQVGFVARPLDGQDYPNTSSLGAIEQQPLFIFTATKLGPLSTPDGLRGRRIVMPPQRSVSSQAALALLAQYDVNTDNTTIDFLPIAQATAALRNGDFDAGFFMLDPQDEFITALAADPNLQLMGLRDTLTLSRLDPGLHPLTLPRGIFDLDKDIPPENVPVLAATITVVARKDLHQAAIYLLLQAMGEVHRGSSLINDAGAFPNLTDISLPANPRASDYEKSGLPWAFQNLPLWLASLVNSYIAIALLFLILIELWELFHYSMELVDFLFVHICFGVLRRIEHRARHGHTLRPREIKLVEMLERALTRSDRRRRSEELIGRIRAARD
jgi:TRAP-type uncharacterized transport system substrate-binding protein